MQSPILQKCRLGDFLFMDWICHICGKEANYNGYGNKYCLIHWKQYIIKEIDVF
jgi:hypothetical protein